jgi:hypothetical protein
MRLFICLRPLSQRLTPQIAALVSQDAGRRPPGTPGLAQVPLCRINGGFLTHDAPSSRRKSIRGGKFVHVVGEDGDAHANAIKHRSCSDPGRRYRTRPWPIPSGEKRLRQVGSRRLIPASRPAAARADHGNPRTNGNSRAQRNPAAVWRVCTRWQNPGRFAALITAPRGRLPFCIVTLGRFQVSIKTQAQWYAEEASGTGHVSDDKTRRVLRGTSRRTQLRPRPPALCCVTKPVNRDSAIRP